MRILAFLCFASASLFALPGDVAKLIQEDRYAEALARVEELLKTSPQDAELSELRASIKDILEKQFKNHLRLAASGNSPELRDLIGREKYPEALELVKKLLTESAQDTGLQRLNVLLEGLKRMGSDDFAKPDVLEKLATLDEIRHLVNGLAYPTLASLPDNLDDQVEKGDYKQALAQVETLRKAHTHDSRFGILAGWIEYLANPKNQNSTEKNDHRNRVLTQIRKEQERLSQMTPGEVSTPAVTPTLPQQPVAKPAASPVKPLSVEDKLTLATLNEISAEIERTTGDLPKRQKLMNEFLAQSAEFVARHPDHSKIWVTRALAALETDNVEAGWKAGQELQRLKVLDSDDAQAMKAMVNLKRKGWLNQNLEAVKTATKDARTAELLAKLDPEQRKLVGTWKLSSVNWMVAGGQYAQSFEGELKIKISDDGNLHISGKGSYSGSMKEGNDVTRFSGKASWPDQVLNIKNSNLNLTCDAQELFDWQYGNDDKYTYTQSNITFDPAQINLNFNLIKYSFRKE